MIIVNIPYYLFILILGALITFITGKNASKLKFFQLLLGMDEVYQFIISILICVSIYLLL